MQANMGVDHVQSAHNYICIACSGYECSVLHLNHSTDQSNMCDHFLNATLLAELPVGRAEQLLTGTFGKTTQIAEHDCAGIVMLLILQGTFC